MCLLRQSRGGKQYAAAERTTKRERIEAIRGLAPPKQEEDKVRRRRRPPRAQQRDGLQLAFRFKDLLKYTGLKKTQLREMIKAGEFPRGVHVSANSRTLVWFEGALIAWQAGARPEDGMSNTPETVYGASASARARGTALERGMNG